MSTEDVPCKCGRLRLVAPQGHITITNYLLNYYPGLDIERRNCHGFTALMKAAMQGRVECVRALMMAGEGELHKSTSSCSVDLNKLKMLNCQCWQTNELVSS